MIIKQRLFLIIISVFLVIMLGSSGYYFMFSDETSFIDCVYMTVISLTTVGYGEVIDVSGNTTAKIFTMILITFGMGIILYGISTLTAIIIEGELSGILREKKMRKMISRLDGHYIVCGGGETGRPILKELDSNGEDFVLIEENPDTIKKCHAIVEDLLFIEGDATDDEKLVDAGINKAAGIIISMPSDKNNLYVTMTARMMNPRMRIITRMTDPKLEPKLYKAGADGVVSPNTIGALRLASEMIRPTVVDFLDKMLRSSQGIMRISQLVIPEDSPLVGKELKETGLRERFKLLVMGAKEKGQEIEFDPSPTKKITPGLTLIFMGEIDNFIKARNWVGS